MNRNDSLVQRCYFLTFITEDIDQVKHIYIMAGSLDAILILPTIVLNILLIISLYRSPQLNKPCTKLLYSLAISDVLVGMVIEPAYLTKKIAELQHSFGMYCRSGMITYVAGGALATITFFNVSAIAVDRYLVVHSGTKYKTIVTNTRVTWVIIAIWASSFVLHANQFIFPRYLYFNISAVVSIFGVAMVSIMYIKCVITLRKQKIRIDTLFRNSSRQRVINVERYKRSTCTMVYVFLILNLCYLPFLCTAVSAGILGESAAMWGAESLSVVLIYANSFLNPIMLFWRMKEIGHAVALTITTAYLARSEPIRKRSRCPSQNINHNNELVVENL
ncbi:melanocyte-stimulating hormone receptor-like [Actinia tenebrosa]|uniref:Melanocyte-stimulating hormone receptor-like n=1 Tax=Actinia tenebrosa TaxID=6105 RepID=A0A6P8I1B4_ACTTE|nr:melanocyte-stimulating hormone receptor-like [Actinia tenebrosa]